TSAAIARDAGVERLIIDPGIGFGKTFEHNLELIASIGEFAKMGYPVLVGPSRKAFIGAILGGVSEDRRLEGTAAVVTACVLNGAHLVRVHDVAEMKKVVTVADAIRTGRV
ncbi:MAG: dihydropteroate synthase, partial [Thermodesulfovibrionales bacterium]|nr:dihydropteroate synthase [Thermodesulfovibrionales bacterium]